MNDVVVKKKKNAYVYSFFFIYSRDRWKSFGQLRRELFILIHTRSMFKKYWEWSFIYQDRNEKWMKRIFEVPLKLSLFFCII